MSLAPSPHAPALFPRRTPTNARLGFCEFLRRSPVQRVLSRGVYEEQYEESLRDCMEGAEGFEEMLGAHRSMVRRAGEGRACLGSYGTCVSSLN